MALVVDLNSGAGSRIAMLEFVLTPGQMQDRLSIPRLAYLLWGREDSHKPTRVEGLRAVP